MHRGPLGTTALNSILQRALNPRAKAGRGLVSSTGGTLGQHDQEASTLDGVGEGGEEDSAENGGGDIVLAPGDRVMQSRNNYEDGVVNGSIGELPMLCMYLRVPAYVPSDDVAVIGCGLLRQDFFLFRRSHSISFRPYLVVAVPSRRMYHLWRVWVSTVLHST